MNIGVLYKTFLEKFESLVGAYAPLKKIPKNEYRFKDKSWIISGLPKSIPIKKTTAYQNLPD